MGYSHRKEASAEEESRERVEGRVTEVEELEEGRNGELRRVV